MNFIRSILIASAITAFPGIALGLGADHPSDQPVGGSSSWPEGLRELVNAPQRVHGYFVNWEDVFFFSGNTDSLNAFLAQYERLPDTKLQVVLHSGTPKVQSPWDKQPRNIAADWKLYSTPFTREQLEAQLQKKDGKLEQGQFVTRLDVWTGLQIDLDSLFIPAEIPVKAAPEAKSDKRIQAFTAARDSKKTIPARRINQVQNDKASKGQSP